MTDEPLEPRIQALLDEVIEEQGLDHEIARGLISRARRLEGKELVQEVEKLLRRA